MKNSKQIVSHIRSKSIFKPLSTIRCIDAVKEILPIRLHKFILFGYIRHNTLFFALNHPGAKQEFDNIINSIKTPLKSIPPIECKNFIIQDIKAFISYKKRLTFTTIKPKQYFAERSNGEFKNNVQDKKLHETVEKIREIIKTNEHK